MRIQNILNSQSFGAKQRPNEPKYSRSYQSVNEKSTNFYRMRDNEEKLNVIYDKLNEQDRMLKAIVNNQKALMAANNIGFRTTYKSIIDTPEKGNLKPIERYNDFFDVRNLEYKA